MAGKTFKVQRRAYLTRDGRVVFGGKDADRLLFCAGEEIDSRTAEKYGLIQHRDPAPIHRDPAPISNPEPDAADELTETPKRRGRPPKGSV